MELTSQWEPIAKESKVVSDLVLCQEGKGREVGMLPGQGGLGRHEGPGGVEPGAKVLLGY